VSSPATERSLITLHDAQADAYVGQASVLLQAARLSAQYPSGAASRGVGNQAGSMLAGYLRAMGSSLHRGLYAQLEVDARAGFPTFKEWTRVWTDVELCPRVLAELPSLEVLRERAPRDPAYGKQLLKALYFSELAKLSLPPFEGMQIRLQRRLADGEAQFQLVLDKLDARGLPLRCTTELSGASTGNPLIALHGDRPEAARELWGMIYRLVSLDAESTFLQLQSLPGLHVHSVTIGTVGPLLCGSVDTLPSWPLPLTRGPGTAVLTCAVDSVLRVDPRLDAAPDRDNDPLSLLFAASLPSSARAEAARARSRLGYRISKDRKFVADAASAAAIKALCTQVGTSNVMYSLPT
jgi:hypothetical protein